MIIVLIINIISLGEKLLSYIAKTSRPPARTHACTRVRTLERTACTRAHTRKYAHTNTHTHCRRRRRMPYRLSLFDGLVVQPWRPAPLPARHWNKQWRWRPGFPEDLDVFAYKKILGRYQTRPQDRMCCQAIRTIWDISRYDCARIAICSLLTPTDMYTCVHNELVYFPDIAIYVDVFYIQERNIWTTSLTICRLTNSAEW